MAAIFLDCTDDLLPLWNRVLKPGDPKIAVNLSKVTPDDVPRLIEGYDTLIDDHTYFNPALLERCRDKGLKRIVFLGTGASSYIDLAAAQRCGIRVDNIKGYGDIAVAEQTLALLMDAARRIARMDRGIREGKWRTLEGMQLHGKRLGLVGLGGIGKEMARLGRGIGMEVVAWNRSAVKDAPVPMLSLDEVLSTSDVVSLHLALTDETKGMIGAAQIKRMKPGVVLVNSARAAVVDEAAMLEALRSGHIRHAALDVFLTEPLPGDHPLTKLDNVTLAAHSGFLTPEATMTMLRISIDMVIAG
jgi:D-3-phosphoglycerate dehydrogenase / 2-oxoglutarate reductase